MARRDSGAAPGASSPHVRRVGSLSPGIQISAASGAPAAAALTWAQGLPAVLPDQFPLYLALVGGDADVPEINIDVAQLELLVRQGSVSQLAPTRLKVVGVLPRAAVMANA